MIANDAFDGIDPVGRMLGLPAFNLTDHGMVSQPLLAGEVVVT